MDTRDDADSAVFTVWGPFAPKVLFIQANIKPLGHNRWPHVPAF